MLKYDMIAQEENLESHRYTISSIDLKPLLASHKLPFEVGLSKKLMSDVRKAGVV